MVFGEIPIAKIVFNSIIDSINSDGAEDRWVWLEVFCIVVGKGFNFFLVRDSSTNGRSQGGGGGWWVF